MLVVKETVTDLFVTNNTCKCIFLAHLRSCIPALSKFYFRATRAEGS